MATAMRSAVIELGIRQLKAELVPPDVAQILNAQKALEQTGVTAQRAAELGSSGWMAFAAQVRELQEEVLRTGDTFEKVLADAVAWEDTLPTLRGKTDEASEAGREHAESLEAQLRGLSH